LYRKRARKPGLPEANEPSKTRIRPDPVQPPLFLAALDHASVVVTRHNRRMVRGVSVLMRKRKQSLCADGKQGRSCWALAYALLTNKAPRLGNGARIWKQFSEALMRANERKARIEFLT